MPSLSPRRTLLALTLAALIGLPSLALAEGMSIDPDGRMMAQTPHGLTHVSREAGMLIDPNGSPTSATPAPTHLSGDSGMSIDPDGQH